MPLGSILEFEIWQEADFTQAHMGSAHPHAYIHMRRSSSYVLASCSLQPATGLQQCRIGTQGREGVNPAGGPISVVIYTCMRARPLVNHATLHAVSYVTQDAAAKAMAYRSLWRLGTRVTECDYFPHPYPTPTSTPTPTCTRTPTRTPTPTPTPNPTSDARPTPNLPLT